MADRILLFANGKIIADGTPDEMKATISRKTISFYSKEKIPKSLLKELPNVTEVQSNEGRFILTTEDTDATLQAIYKRNLPVTDVSVERGSLDEAFEQFVANQKGNSMKALWMQCKIEILRTFRNKLFIFFSLLMPVMFYYIFTNVIQVPQNGDAWKAHYLISMATFSIVGTALFSFGVRISQEKGQGWTHL